MGKIEADSFNDRAFGAILGAFIGDSCGSFNEFNKNVEKSDFMDKCMTMPGGGPFRLAPGQITDDSELAMMMMHGLVDPRIPDGNSAEVDASSRKDFLVLDNIAEAYGNWI